MIKKYIKIYFNKEIILIKKSKKVQIPFSPEAI